MKIVIKFNDSWENSFSEGSLETHFNKPRAFIGSSASGFDSYKHVETTHNTIMGILNRLIGDQRRLVQCRKDPDYFFQNLENKISFEEKKDVTNEIVFLRNINKVYDQNGFAGPKQEETSQLFSSYFDRLWGPLEYSLQELFDLIINNKECSKKLSLNHDRITLGGLISQYTEKNKDMQGIKPDLSTIDLLAVAESLIKRGLLDKEDTDKGISYKIIVYCGIYCVLENIVKSDQDFKKNLSRDGKITGLAKRSFTYKDFVSAVSKKKRVLGNPSSFSGYLTVEGKEKKVYTEYKVKRKSGEITISIDASLKEQLEIKELIINSGVGSFSVGKKGLAYIDDMWEE